MLIMTLLKCVLLFVQPYQSDMVFLVDLQDCALLHAILLLPV